MKKVVFRLILIAVLLGGGYGIYRMFQGMPGRVSSVPTTKVRKGDVVVRSFTRGELRAVRTATLSAPNLFGNVQVTRLAPLGALSREKDLIVEFDDSEVLSRLESKQLELEQVDEQIKKAIIYGGAAVGKSPIMPSSPDLDSKPEVVNALVKQVRDFGK